jgi:hypothetical protein
MKIAILAPRVTDLTATSQIKCHLPDPHNKKQQGMPSRENALPLKLFPP